MKTYIGTRDSQSGQRVDRGGAAEADAGDEEAMSDFLAEMTLDDHDHDYQVERAEARLPHCALCGEIIRPRSGWRNPETYRWEHVFCNDPQESEDAEEDF